MTEVILSVNQENDEGYKSQPEIVITDLIELANINLEIQSKEEGSEAKLTE
jgi:hypothetical protein